ncbi:MAG: ABC transporter ATP-binding protein [Deltaproteobacteria bacterium]|nr:ABC transporter ATP-binding protein [Deltaproteobacteria bacterium]
MIEIRGLHKSFGDNHVLQGIDLSIERGQTTVIIGGSGSGKSVLMKHMMGLLKPDSGEVEVDGEDITGMSERELVRVRRKFGMVFQQAALFDSMTVGENVAFALREHRRLSEREIWRIVAEKLALVDLHDTERLYPAELSGGMRKRVGLARAIVLDPKIILYDEPTTGLDPITTNSVDHMIMNAQQRLGVTSVVISHDIASSFRVGHHVAMLYRGHIVAQGTPDMLRSSTHAHVQEFLSTWFDR